MSGTGAGGGCWGSSELVQASPGRNCCRGAHSVSSVAAGKAEACQGWAAALPDNCCHLLNPHKRTCELDPCALRLFKDHHGWVAGAAAGQVVYRRLGVQHRGQGRVGVCWHPVLARAHRDHILQKQPGCLCIAGLCVVALSSLPAYLLLQGTEACCIAVHSDQACRTVLHTPSNHLYRLAVTTIRCVKSHDSGCCTFDL
jgi:hypothetical protein